MQKAKLYDDFVVRFVYLDKLPKDQQCLVDGLTIISKRAVRKLGIDTSVGFLVKKIRGVDIVVYV